MSGNRCPKIIGFRVAMSPEGTSPKTSDEPKNLIGGRVSTRKSTFRILPHFLGREQLQEVTLLLFFGWRIFYCKERNLRKVFAWNFGFLSFFREEREIIFTWRWHFTWKQLLHGSWKTCCQSQMLGRKCCIHNYCLVTSSILKRSKS